MEAWMSSQYVRLLDARVLAPSQVCPIDKVVDLGAYGKLEIDPRVMTVGNGGNLIVETSATNEDGSWRTIATIPLNAVANLLQVTSFLRFVRWRTDAAVAGSPVVIVDILAKEG
jgi:hypothetical protein